MKKEKPNIPKTEQNNQAENFIEMSTFRYARENGSKQAYKIKKKSKNVQFELKEDENEYCFSS
jgi:hypothetical protein